MIKAITLFKAFLLVSLFFLMFITKPMASEVNFSLLKTDSGKMTLNRDPVNFLNGLPLGNSLYLYKFVGLNTTQTKTLGTSKKLQPVIGLGLGIQRNYFGYGLMLNSDNNPVAGLTFGF
jgi:hypothetical protein